MKTSLLTATVAAVLAGVIALRAENNNQQPTKRVVKTLPMVKAGDTPSYVKPIGGSRTTAAAKPPALDPYAWISPNDTSTVPRQWTLTGKTNIAAFLVKFNRFTVVVRDETDREFQFDRKALSKDGQSVISGFEKEKEAEIRQEWQEKQDEKKAALEAQKAGQ